MGAAAPDVAPAACFAPCPRGLEASLVDELAEIGLAGATVAAGGVHFDATWAEAWRVNLRSRLASRVLLRVAAARYRSEDDIYRIAHACDWSRWFGAQRTLRVDTTGGSGRAKSPLRSLEFVTLRVKDGICDRFRETSGRRPSIDTRTPDVRVFAYLDASTCTLYLDTSGEPLFKRGWRADAGVAPLRENLAAGLLRLAGWRPGTPLLDPMCGSGTIVVEAAQAALGIAPGAQRSFGFERLNTFDDDAWQSMRREVAQADEQAAALIRGADVSGDAVAATRANLERAGLGAALATNLAPKQIDARQAKPHAGEGLVVTNPPYGERLAIRGEETRGDGRGDDRGDDDTAFFGMFGDTLKQRFAGWTANLLSPDRALDRKLRLAPERRTVLYNGAIECRLYRFPIVAGANRGPRGRDAQPADNKGGVC